LARAALMAHGHVLTDTSKQPGLLAEMVVARGEMLEKRGDEFQALYRAWLRAIAWAKKNPNDSAQLIAAGIGRWLRDDDVVKEMREGIVYYDGPMNESFRDGGKTWPARRDHNGRYRHLVGIRKAANVCKADRIDQPGRGGGKIGRSAHGLNDRNAPPDLLENQRRNLPRAASSIS
jgi:hypothetical protein